MTIFLVIGGLGIVVLVVSLLVGDFLSDVDLGLDSDLFSTASIAGFLGAFGFVGAATQQLTSLTFLSITLGVLAGIGFGAAAIKLSRILKGGERSDAFSVDSLVGSDAIVITDIPAGGFGEIHLSARGHVTKLNARAAHAIAAGSPVWVSGVVSPTAVEVTATNKVIEGEIDAV